MDIEKIRKWLEITNDYRESDFWSSVLKQKSPDSFFRENHQYQLKYDLYQNEYSNFVIVELPGINREDLTLNLISNSQLMIKGMIRPIIPIEKVLVRERYYGEFERVIELSEKTEPHLLNIDFMNGLLLISYPRKIESIPFK